mgnify:CR=1 FL=1
MKIRTILLMGGLVLLGACSESKYDLDQLVPEEYHKILYVNNSCLLYTSDAADE